MSHGKVIIHRLFNAGEFLMNGGHPALKEREISLFKIPYTYFQALFIF